MGTQVMMVHQGMTQEMMVHQEKLQQEKDLPKEEEVAVVTEDHKNQMTQVMTQVMMVHQVTTQVMMVHQVMTQVTMVHQVMTQVMTQVMMVHQEEEEEDCWLDMSHFERFESFLY